MENHMELTFLACAQNEAFARVAIAAFAVQQGKGAAARRQHHGQQ